MSEPVEVQAAVGADGIAVIRHGLGTEDVAVACLTRDGARVGYLAAVPVSADEVEVVTVPGSGVEIVQVAPGEGGRR